MSRGRVWTAADLVLEASVGWICGWKFASSCLRIRGGSGCSLRTVRSSDFSAISRGKLLGVAGADVAARRLFSLAKEQQVITIRQQSFDDTDEIFAMM